MRLLPYDPEGRDACVEADERMIRTSRRLLAVWDGSPSDERDATAHLVAYARAQGHPRGRGVARGRGPRHPGGGRRPMRDARRDRSPCPGRT